MQNLGKLEVTFLDNVMHAVWKHACKSIKQYLLYEYAWSETKERLIQEQIGDYE